MARSWFAGSHLDVVIRPYAFGQRRLADMAAEVDVTFWDAEEGGNKVTDLLLDGTIVTSQITSDADGYLPRFQGPDDVLTLWADAGFGRRFLMITTDGAIDLSAQLSTRIPTSEKGQPDGVATLDASGRLAEYITAARIDGLIPAENLPDAIYVNALHHGVVGDGVTDDTAALNAIAATVQALGGNAVLAVPSGDYAISGAGVTFRCAVEADQATLIYSGSGTALTVGHPTAVTFRRRYNLPRVKKTTREWSDGAIGIKLSNLNTCNVWMPNVENFDFGLVCWGDTTGFAYNTVTLGTTWQCMKSITLDASDTGWSNQNLFLGGRCQQVFQAGMTDEDPNSWQLKIGHNPNAWPNNNTFVNLSLEGDNPGFYRLTCNGAYNVFTNCRWEMYGAPNRVYWGVNAYGNIIDGGYDAHNLTETFADTTSKSNLIRDRVGAYINATGVTAGTVVTSATWTYVTDWTQTSARAGTYNNGFGVWTPRPGRWRISAAALFPTNTTGTRRMARLLAGGATVIATSMHAPATAYNTHVRVDGTFRFDGTQSVALQAWQDSGGDLTTLTTTGYSYMHAEWVGP